MSNFELLGAAPACRVTHLTDKTCLSDGLRFNQCYLNGRYCHLSTPCRVTKVISFAPCRIELLLFEGYPMSPCSKNCDILLPNYIIGRGSLNIIHQVLFVSRCFVMGLSPWCYWAFSNVLFEVLDWKSNGIHVMSNHWHWYEFEVHKVISPIEVCLNSFVSRTEIESSLCYHFYP